MKKYSTVILWLRNDLRIYDNEALVKACRDAEFVLPVFCFDPRQFATTRYGFPKTGAHRTRFLLESLADMRQNLQSLGANLLLRRDKPEEIIPALAHEIKAEAVFYHEEATDEELRVEEDLGEALAKIGVKRHSYWGSTLMHIDDLPFNTEQTPDVFTQFRKTVEKKCTPRPTFGKPHQISLPGSVDSNAFGELPRLQDLIPSGNSEHDSRAVLPFKGGETEALKRLQEYFWERDKLRDYKETRNGLVGSDYSSKFSAWLALGCISPRFIHEEVKRYENERVANDSTYWLIFELLWRDFFRFTALKYDTKLFHKNGLMNVKKPWREDHVRFDLWKQGMTGIPFIDANMRELAETGFMSNRGRQNVASFLVRDLNVHWLMGAEYFESVLVDYDVCSNYGNWNYAAGIGNDPREDRYFNIMRQASMYDAKGDYVRLWLPELGSVPNAYVHEPHKMSIEEQKRADCRIGVDYPNPVVNLEETSKKFR